MEELFYFIRLHLVIVLIEDLSLWALRHKVSRLLPIKLAELIFVLKHFFCYLDRNKCVNALLRRVHFQMNFFMRILLERVLPLAGGSKHSHTIGGLLGFPIAPLDQWFRLFSLSHKLICLNDWGCSNAAEFATFNYLLSVLRLLGPFSASISLLILWLTVSYHALDGRRSNGVVWLISTCRCEFFCHRI